MGGFGRDGPRRKGRRKKRGRETVWWYKAGWRGVLVGTTAFVWRRTKWKPIICVTTVDLVDVPRRQWMSVIGEHIMALKKDVHRKVEGEAAAVIDERSSKKWPVLVDHLTQTCWEDGTPRQTSTLSVFVGDGAFKGLLKDRETQQTLWVASPTLDKLFDVVEAALNDPGFVWRREKQQPGDRASRVKGRTA